MVLFTMDKPKDKVKVPCCPPEMSEVDKAYIAGILDGEGTIGFRGKKDKQITLTVKISNTDESIIKFLKAKIPIGASTCKLRMRKNPKHKPVWEIQWRSFKSVKYILESLKPYLIIKDKQATVALNFIRNRDEEFNNYHQKGLRDDKGRFVKIRDYRYSDEDLIMVDKMHEFNRRGL